MSTKSVTTGTPTLLFKSEYGTTEVPTSITFCVVGAGKIWWDHDSSVSSSTGLPLEEGQYVSGDFKAGSYIYAVADSGTVDVRIIDTGAN